VLLTAAQRTYYPGSKEGHIPTRSASFDVALFRRVVPEREISENGETVRNGRILGISPA
jgi:hypothetical protein